SRTTVLRHTGQDGEIDLRAAESFTFLVREPIERMFHLTGGWMGENATQRTHPRDAVLTLESGSGKTGFPFQPYIALRTERDTYVCQLLWSGNWRRHIGPKNRVLL